MLPNAASQSTHLRSLHFWLPGHWLKQPPQALLSVLKLKQRTWPSFVGHSSGLSRGHLHLPSLQLKLEGQTARDAPHARLDVRVSTHRTTLLGPTRTSALPSVHTHLPLLQRWERGQMLKQPPQWYSSLLVLAQRLTAGLLAVLGMVHSVASRPQDLLHFPSMHFSS